MKKMWKLSAIVLSLLMFATMTLVAGGQTKAVTTEEGWRPGLAHLPNLGKPKDIDEIEIFYIGASLTTSDYSRYVYRGVEERMEEYKKETGKSYNLTFNASDIALDHDGVMQLVETAILKGVDIISLHPTILTMNLPIIDKCYQAKIPLIIYNVGWKGVLKPEEDFPVMSYIGYEHYDGGRLVGEFVADYLGADSTDYTGLTRIAPGDFPEGRGDGFVDVLKDKAPKIRVQSTYQSGGGRAEIQQIVTSYLTGYPQMKVLYPFWSSAAMAAVAAVEALGMQGKVGVIGYGCVKEEVEAMLDGRLMASILRGPRENGIEIANTIIKWWEGREDDIEIAYSTFQKLIYSPDQIKEWIDPIYWEEWASKNEWPEITWPEEKDSFPGREKGLHDPDHLRTCTWLERFGFKAE